MLEHAPQLVYKLRFLLMSIVLLMSFVLLSVFLSAVKPTGYVGTQNTSEYYPSESSNVVSTGMGEFMYELSTVGGTIKRGSVTTLIAVTEGAEKGRQHISSGLLAAVKFGGSILLGATKTVGSIIGFSASLCVGGLVYALEVPGNIIGFFGNTAVMGSVIRPAEHAEIPIIDPNSPALIEAKLAIVKPSTGQQQAVETPMWPIRGEVTTEFGVKHWPYQAVHTGLDISDGQRSGVTPIHPFKSGTVIFAGRANNGLGNHVILDHGNGITSVYAHLYSITTTVGQNVSQAAILGYEGSTGVSTGTHLHFEIRVNGMAADPGQFITGRPY